MDSYSILLVDDEESSLSSLKRALGREYNVFLATNGKDALTTMEQGDIDLIIADYRMPGMTGIELLEIVRQKYPNTIRIILTAYTDQELLMDAVNKVRAHNYLTKPWDPEEIQSIVREWEAVRRLEVSEAKRKLVEEALQKSEEKYRTLVENANEAILVIQDRRLKFVNPKGVELTGYSEKELAARPFMEFIHPDDREMVIERHLKRLKGEALPHIYAFRIVDKDRNTKWVEINAVLIAWEERPAALNFLTEITERKRAEEALREERASLAQRVEERTVDLKAANEELAKASRLKDEFLASMSHELRTPLTAVLGMSEVMRKGIYGPVNDNQMDALQRIEESGHHLLDLINDILDVAKIGAGKLELDVGQVSVQSVCQTSLQFVMPNANRKKLRVSSSMDSEVTALQADERRLKEILVNLLSNAIKFTPEGGSIGLEVIGDPKRRQVHFAVWDTGIGIPQEDMELLFQPFVQLDGKLSRQHSGTGLGLALVRKMTELHGGSVSVDSKVDQGSRFTVSLPWQVKTIEAVEEAEPEESGIPAEEPMTSVVTPDQELEMENR